MRATSGASVWKKLGLDFERSFRANTLEFLTISTKWYKMLPAIGKSQKLDNLDDCVALGASDDILEHCTLWVRKVIQVTKWLNLIEIISLIFWGLPL